MTRIVRPCPYCGASIRATSTEQHLEKVQTQLISTQRALADAKAELDTARRAAAAWKQAHKDTRMAQIKFGVGRADYDAGCRIASNARRMFRKAARP